MWLLVNETPVIGLLLNWAVVVNGIPTSSEQVVVHFDVGDRTEIIVDHDGGGLSVVINDGVVADRHIGVRRRRFEFRRSAAIRRLQTVNVVIPDD